MTNNSTLLTSILTNTNVKELLANNKHQQLISIDSKATIKEAVKILSVNKIASAPVYESASDSFLGVLEYGHLVKYVLQVLHKLPKEEDDVNISLVISFLLPIKFMFGRTLQMLYNLQFLTLQFNIYYLLQNKNRLGKWWMLTCPSMMF